MQQLQQWQEQQRLKQQLEHQQQQEVLLRQLYGALQASELVCDSVVGKYVLGPLSASSDTYFASTMCTFFSIPFAGKPRHLGFSFGDPSLRMLEVAVGLSLTGLLVHEAALASRDLDLKLGALWGNTVERGLVDAAQNPWYPQGLCISASINV